MFEWIKNKLGQRDYHPLPIGPKKHLVLLRYWEGKDPWFDRDRGVWFEWKCRTTGTVFRNFDSGNYKNLCVSFKCEGCGGDFRGDQMDQPFVKDAEQRLKEYWGHIS